MSDFTFKTTAIELSEYLPCKFIEVIKNIQGKTGFKNKGSLIRFIDEANKATFVGKWSNDTDANYEEVVDWIYHPKTGDCIPTYLTGRQKRRQDFEEIADLGIPLNMNKGGI